MTPPLTTSYKYTSPRYLIVLCLFCMQCLGGGTSEHAEIDGISNFTINNLDDEHLKKILKELRRGKKDNIDEPDEDGNTALHLATGLKYSGNRLKIVAYLLKQEASVNKENKKGLTPLNLLVKKDPTNTDTLKLLLKHKADVNKADKEGVTPLMYSLKGYNNEEVLEALLDKDPDLKATDKEQKTVLHRIFYDSSTDRLSNLKLLLKHEKTNTAVLKAKDKDGNTLLHAALSGKYPHTDDDRLEAFKLLVEKMKEEFKKSGMTQAELKKFEKNTADEFPTNVSKLSDYNNQEAITMTLDLRNQLP